MKQRKGEERRGIWEEKRTNRFQSPQYLESQWNSEECKEAYPEVMNENARKYFRKGVPLSLENTDGCTESEHRPIEKHREQENTNRSNRETFFSTSIKLWKTVPFFRRRMTSLKAKYWK
jgi:hypothetical protein